MNVRILLCAVGLFLFAGCASTNRVPVSQLGDVVVFAKIRFSGDAADYDLEEIRDAAKAGFEEGLQKSGYNLIIQKNPSKDLPKDISYIFELQIFVTDSVSLPGHLDKITLTLDARALDIRRDKENPRPFAIRNDSTKVKGMNLGAAKKAAHKLGLTMAQRFSRLSVPSR